jgi:hypothetical protein
MDRYVTHASFTLERSYPVPRERIVYTSTMSADAAVITVSLTADQLKALATVLESDG